MLNAESGSLAGTLGTGATSGPTPAAIDASLGLAFILGSVQYATVSNQIQLFNPSNFTSTGTAAIPVNVASYTPAALSSDLTRWGTNGLAFRNSLNIYVLRSNLVKDLSASPADLGVTLTSSGSNTTGSQSTYVATISNAGPSSASEVELTAPLLSTGVLVAATPSSGSCSTATDVSCDLGTLGSGATATVSLIVSQLTPGNATTTVQVSASQVDPNLADNQAALTATITGSTYTVAPTLVSMTPSTILAGSSDTVVTISGAGFGSGSAVQLDGIALPTNVISGTQLSATVPADSLASLGWHLVSVSNPSPGGGTSSRLPLSVYNVIKAGANHILYDPFSRRIFATLGSATASGNSIEALTPETGTFTTPVPVGSEPTRMALSDDGQILYILASGSNRIIRYNMLTQQPESDLLVSPTFGSNQTAAELAVQPGSENTIGVTQSTNLPIEIVDFDPVNHTAAARSSNSGSNSGHSPRFLDPSTLLVAGSFSTLFQRYTVTSAGLNPLDVAFDSSLAPAFSPFKLVNGIAFTSDGGVANFTTQPALQLGTFPFNATNSEASVAPDPTLGRVFFLAGINGTSYTSFGLSGVVAFDFNSFLPVSFLPLNIAATEGTTTSTAIDVIRWARTGSLR